ncbi:hypothetical protein [Streptomyces sp. WL006]|uniref:hypothetical protein n=1 Tax=Streptomyces sp. WL006 TaxID=3423915 RepID=UPI003F6B6805
MTVGIASTLAVDAAPASYTKAVALQASAHLAPWVCVTLIVLLAMRRWTNSYDLKSRRLFQELADERTKFREECRLRSAKLDAREQRINRTAEQDGIQLRSSAARLTETMMSLAEERTKNAELTDTYKELVEDYNTVVVHVLQDRADRFRRPTAEPLRPAAGLPYSALRVSPDAAVDPSPPLPIRLRRIPTPTTEPTQHDRPVDNVGDPA